MIIITDTSPLNYLVLIDEVNILPELFQEVLIPFAVKQELQTVGASEKLKRWIENAPHWLKVESVKKVDESINLGIGEVEAISLAVEISANLILLDDKAARLAAKQRDLEVIGTLGILKLADKRGLIDFKITVEKIQTTNFRISEILLKKLLNS